jgi:hypothetical protein
MAESNNARFSWYYRKTSKQFSTCNAIGYFITKKKKNLSSSEISRDQWQNQEENPTFIIYAHFNPGE